jgi:tetratricopeptide (TPR) repeat protein
MHTVTAIGRGAATALRDQFNFSGDFRGAVVTIGVERATTRASLEEARKRFSELPVDGEIPLPAPLPPGSVMQWPANPLFVARTEGLHTLARILSGQTVAVASQLAAASGLGGIGKTQIAVEFAHRYGQFFCGGVFWINCEDPNTIASQVASCGGVGGLDLHGNFGELTLPEQVSLVRAEWNSPQPRLIVFDNCETEELLAAWRPNTGGSRVLVTSRRVEWGRSLGVSALHLDVLERQNSIDLLSSFNEDTQAPVRVLNDIAQELGDLPLALHMAGAFLGRYRHSAIGEPTRYLERLRSALLDHPSLTQGEWSPTGHDQHVARTFALSYESLDPTSSADRGALGILGILCCYAPGSLIPRSYISARGDAGESEEDLELGKANGIRRLSDLGLIREHGTHLFVHRLVSAFVNARTGEEVRLSLENDIVEAASYGNLTQDSRYIAEWEIQLFHVTERALACKSLNGPKLLREVAVYHLNRGNYAGAQKANRRRLEIAEEISPRNNEAIASVLNDCAVSIRPFNQDESAKLIQRSIEIQLDDPKSFELTLIFSYINLGEALADLQKSIVSFEEAHRRFKTVWARPESLPGAHQVRPEEGEAEDDPTRIDPDALWVRIICGLARRYSEDSPTRAEKFLLDELKPESTSEVGFRHWEVLQSLGIFRRKMGDLARARLYLEAALTVGEDRLGDRAPVLGDIHYDLGTLCEEAGDNRGAKISFEKAFEIALPALGWDHRATQACSDGLYRALTKMGDFSAVKSHISARLDHLDAHPGRSAEVLPHILFVAGFACFQLHELESAERHWRRGLSIAKRNKNRHRTSIRMINKFLASLRKNPGGPHARPVQLKR